MYIKIIYHNYDNKNFERTRFFQCNSAEYRKVNEKIPGEPEKLFLVLDLEDGTGSLPTLWFGEVDITLYFMNEFGKTIDMLNWQNGEYK